MMPGFLLHQGAKVRCTHGGEARPTSVDPRVKVCGQPVVTQTVPYAITGCSLPPPPNGNGPCATAQWLVGTSRVTAGGFGVLLANGRALCTPSSTPLIVQSSQTRVRGT